MSDQWGVGNQADAKSFDTIKLGNEQLELIFGEHPHSRQDNRIYARTKSKTIWAFDGHRTLVDISLKTHNYLKDSELSGQEIRKSCTAIISFNGTAIYEVTGREWDNTLLKTHSVVHKLLEHPLDLHNEVGRNAIVGRKVFWRDTPAVITRFINDQGCVIIKTDGVPYFPKPVYKETDDQEDEIKDDILSGSFWWYRD